MKKIYLVLLLIVSIATAHAQIGFEGGLNMANLSIKSDGTKVGTKFKAGAAFGMFIDCKLDQDGHIYFEPGAFYQNNGAKIKSTPSGGEYDINSANFPLNIEYKSGDKCSKRFFAGIGPYIGDNLNGSYDFGGGTNSADLKIGTDIQRLDLGIGVNVGFIGRKHWYMRAHYQQGMINEIPNGNAQNSIKQSSGGLTIGYMFRGCRRRGRHGSAGSGEGNHWRGLKKNRWSRHQIFRREHGPANY